MRRERRDTKLAVDVCQSVHRRSTQFVLTFHGYILELTLEFARVYNTQSKVKIFFVRFLLITQRVRGETDLLDSFGLLFGRDSER